MTATAATADLSTATTRSLKCRVTLAGWKPDTLRSQFADQPDRLAEADRIEAAGRAAQAELDRRV